MTHNNFIKFDFEGKKIYGVVRDGRVLAVLQKSGKIQLLDIPIESASGKRKIRISMDEASIEARQTMIDYTYGNN